MSVTWEEIKGPVTDLCRKMGFPDVNYVHELVVAPDELTVVAYKGRDGRCKGAKYIQEDGEPAMETVKQKVKL